MKRTKLKVAGIVGVILSSIVLLFALLTLLDMIFALVSVVPSQPLSKIFGFISVLFYSVPGLLLVNFLQIGPTAIIIYALNIFLIAFALIWIIGSARAIKVLKASPDEFYAKKSMFKRNAIYTFIFASFLIVAFIASLFLTGRILPQLLLLIVFAGGAITYGILVFKQIKSIPTDTQSTATEQKKDNV